MITRLLIPLAALAVLSPVCSFAADSPAEQRLQKALTDTIAVAEQSPNKTVLLQKVRPVAEKNLCFAVMTRRAIGPGWRQFSPEQQKQAVSLFSELIIRRYVNRFTLGERLDITYKPAATVAPGKVEIPTVTVYKGSPYEVIYRLEQSEDWRITDVIVEGVSFIGNYRSQFDAQFQKGGPAAVLAALNSTVENPK